MDPLGSLIKASRAGVGDGDFPPLLPLEQPNFSGDFESGQQ